MLHDGIIGRTVPGQRLDRRRSDRVPFPAHLTVVWHHDLEKPVRYQVTNAGDGGFQIRSSTPLDEGTTGTALRLLPEGLALNRSIMVVWSRHDEASGGFEAGLRLF
jgi:hypothetical protein